MEQRESKKHGGTQLIDCSIRAETIKFFPVVMDPQSSTVSRTLFNQMSETQKFGLFPFSMAMKNPDVHNQKFGISSIQE